MAVKPLTQPLYWATDAVYSTGPFVGQPQKVTPPLGFAAEGHRPGALFPTPAEYENSQQYNLTGLARWVFAGSSAGAADAHPLETDATGATQVQAASVVPTGPFAQALLVNAPAAAGYGILATGASADATVRAETTGSAPAIEAVSTVAAGSCIRASASGTSDAIVIAQVGTGIGLTVNGLGGAGHGASINYAGSGRALQVVGGTGDTAIVVAAGSGQNAITAASGANAGAAVAAAGAGTAYGIDAFGGNGSGSAHGVRGTAVHVDATGVYGRTSTSASTTATGVTAEGRGAGTTGLLALNEVGRAAVFQGDASSPAYAATRWVPQDADPTSGTNDGEVFWHASHKTLRTSVAGAGWRSMPTLGPGSAFIVQATQATNATFTATAVLTTMLTATLDTGEGTGYYGAASNAKIHIKFSGEVRLTIGPTADTLNIRVIDVTNAAIIAEWSGAGTAGTNGFYIPSATLNWQRMVGFGVLYQPPGDGDITVTVNVSRVTNNLQIRNGTVVLTGTFA